MWIQKLVESLPWYIRLPAGVCGAIVAHFADQLPKWLEPYAILGGAGLFAWVAVSFLWHAINHWKVEHGKAPLMLEPWHIIALGVGLSFGGLVWQWRHAPQIAPQITQLQSQIDDLKNQLGVAKSTLASVVQPPAVAPVGPPTIAVGKALTPRDIQRLLEALDELNTLGEKVILPAIAQVATWAANWRGVLRNQNGVELFTRVSDGVKADVWGSIDKFLSNHPQYETQLQSALALDHPAAKNEVSKSAQEVIAALKRLPRDAPPEMDDLVEPQFKELQKQSNLMYTWWVEAKQRINEMTINLKTGGVAEYTKR